MSCLGVIALGLSIGQMKVGVNAYLAGVSGIPFMQSNVDQVIVNLAIIVVNS